MRPPPIPLPYPSRALTRFSSTHLSSPRMILVKIHNSRLSKIGTVVTVLATIVTTVLTIWISGNGP
jgi:hypothetical protein